MEVEEQIEELNTLLGETILEIDKLTTEIKSLKNRYQIASDSFREKERELKDLEQKLFECNNQRKEIRDELDKKIVELETSELSKEEIAQEVIKLTTKIGFCEVREKLVETWKSYAKSKDTFIELLEQHAIQGGETVDRLKDCNQNLWSAIWILIGTVVLLSLSLSLYITKKKTKK